jgi:hypothetical protein
VTLDILQADGKSVYREVITPWKPPVLNTYHTSKPAELSGACCPMASTAVAP